MRAVMGIDVSKSTLNYVIITAVGEILDEDKVLNNIDGFEKILYLQKKYKTEVIFEATGVYSRRIQFFLELNTIEYIRMNPLEAKKEMDTLRVTKNDRIDAKGLAHLQIEKNYKAKQIEQDIYIELRHRHRFYQEIVKDSVSSKNRLKKVLQDTFSEIENLFVGDNPILYKIVKLFPHAEMVKNKSIDEIVYLLKDNINVKLNRINDRAEKLIDLANITAVSVKVDSILTEEAVYWANNIIELSQLKEKIINEMVELASDLREVKIIESIPGFGKTSAVTLVAELGDIRRFKTPQKMNAFIGIDLHFYDSGKKKTHGSITKRGNYLARKIMFQNVKNMVAASKKSDKNNYVTIWYERRKLNENNGSKKIIVGAMDRTFRLIHHLVVNDEMFIQQ